MSRVMQWLGGAVLGIAIGLPGSIHAQNTLKKEDLVGAWEYTAPAARSSSLARVRLTFRPDRKGLLSEARTFGVDTFWCSDQFQWQVSNDTLVWMEWWRNTTKFPKPLQNRLTLKDQHLLTDDSRFGSKSFTRLASPVAPLSEHISPAAAPQQPLTGKLAELVGVWELLPAKGGAWLAERPAADTAKLLAGLVQTRLTIRPDLTLIKTRTFKDGSDKFTCSGAWSLKPKTVAGDTVLFAQDREGVNSGNIDYAFVLQGKELVSLFHDGQERPYVWATYKRVSSTP